VLFIFDKITIKFLDYTQMHKNIIDCHDKP